jgi:hypothetical protein
MAFDEFKDASNFVISFTNDPKGDFKVFAKGYTHAANRLAELLLGAPRFSDYEAYLVVFLYRHALELSLKHIIYASTKLAVQRRPDEIDRQLKIKLKNTHNLTNLSRAACELLLRLFPKDEYIRRLSSAIAKTCDDWSKIDSGSYAYRYPVDQEGQTSTKWHQTVNLRTLAARMSALHEDLDTVHFGIGYEIEEAEDLYDIFEQLDSPEE